MQNKKIIPTVIAVVLVIAVAAFAFMQSKPQTTDQGDMIAGEQASSTPASSTPSTAPTSSAPTSTKPTPTPTPTPTGSKSYTLAQVAMHANASSCWTAINGNVYDLTKWIPQHPGGEQAILQICGKDGSAAFNAQHGGMQRQATILATFKIGVLAK